MAKGYLNHHYHQGMVVGTHQPTPPDQDGSTSNWDRLIALFLYGIYLCTVLAYFGYGIAFTAYFVRQQFWIY